MEFSKTPHCSMSGEALCQRGILGGLSDFKQKVPSGGEVRRAALAVASSVLGGVISELFGDRYSVLCFHEPPMNRT